MTTRFLILAMAFLLSGPAFAACTGPAGDVGNMIYDDMYRTPSYCDGMKWVRAIRWLKESPRSQVSRKTTVL